MFVTKYHNSYFNLYCFIYNTRDAYILLCFLGSSFEEIVSYIRRHEEFSLCFQDDTYYNCSTALNNVLHDDSRVPFHLAIEPIAESENCLLKQHVDRLTNIRRRHTEKAFLETSLHHGFRNCLTATLNGDFSDERILPGQPLSDVKSNISSLDLLELTKEEISGVSHIQYFLCFDNILGM